jgi:hypothetical protein
MPQLRRGTDQATVGVPEVTGTAAGSLSSAYVPRRRQGMVCRLRLYAYNFGLAATGASRWFE